MMLSYTLWGFDPKTGFDPSRTFVRSHFVSPLVLACIRLLICVYCFTTIITSYTWLANNTATVSLKDVNISSYVVHQSKGAIGQTFSFLTYLTFWSLGFYFLVSSVHTFMFAIRHRTWLHNWPRPLQLAHSLYYTTVTTLPFLVTIVFWGTMNSGWPSGRFEQWSNISVHGLNSVFAITEIILPATQPAPLTHLLVVLLVLSVYLGLSYLTKWTQGFYVYEWMNPAHGDWSIVAHVAAFGGAMIVIFFLVRFAVMGRNKLAERMGSSESEGLEEKALEISDSTEAWSDKVDVKPPRPVRQRGDHLV